MSTRNIIEASGNPVPAREGDQEILAACLEGIQDLRKEYLPRYRQAGFTLDVPSVTQGIMVSQLVYPKIRGAQWAAFPSASLTTVIMGRGISVRVGNTNMRNTINGVTRTIRMYDDDHFEFNRWFRPDDTETTVPAEDREVIEDDGMRVAAAMAYYGQALDTILQKIMT